MILISCYLLGFIVQTFRFIGLSIMIESKLVEIKNHKLIGFLIYLILEFLFWWLFVVLDLLQDLGLIKKKIKETVEYCKFCQCNEAEKGSKFCKDCNELI